MKNFIIIFTMTLMFTSSVIASSAGSLWNGDHYNLKGKMLVQDADSPDKYYWLPNRFKLKTQSVVETDKNGNQHLVNKQLISHTIINDESGNSYSKYDLKVKIESISKNKRHKVTRLLRKKAGYDAKLVGRIQICGISLGIPASVGTTAVNTDAIQVTYGFAEDDEGSCNNFNVPKTFNISFIVPSRFEPGFAQSLVNGIGPVLPSIILSYPHKYTDHVSLSINAEKFQKFISKDGSIKGSFKFVQAGVSANIKKTLRTLQYTGHMHFDIQNSDPKIRAHYETLFTDILSKHFFSFTNSAAGGNSNSDASAMTFQSKGKKGSSGAMIEASIAINKAEAKEIGTINMSLDNVSYGAITGQLTVDIPAIDKKYIHKSIRDLLN